MRTPWVFFAVLGAMAHVGLALAQGSPSGSSVQATGVSPVGYSSAVNTPTGQVLPEGTLSMSLANNNPELAKRIQGVGGFGSLNFGVGLLPGLEAFGRLAFEGDLQCNMYLPSCRAPMRDLSVSAKYQLPLNLPLNTKLAAGLTDYGGAATNFRSAYAVATSEQGPFDVSIGYGKGQSDRALLQGVFSSAVVRLTEHLQAQLERNAGNMRLGASYQLPLGDGADLVLAASRFVGANPAQAGLPLNSSQLSLALRLHLDRSTQQALKKPAPALEPARWAASQNSSTDSAVSSTLSSSPSGQIASDLTSQAVPGLRAQNEALAAELKRALISEGFTRVGVTLERQETRGVTVHAYRVWAEPTAYRQSSLQAIGRAVRVWLQSVAAAKGQHMAERKGTNKLSHETHKNASFNSSDFEDLPNELTVALTYLGRPVLAAKTTEQCAKLFRGGHDVCGQDRAVQLLKPSDLPRDFLQVVQAHGRAADVARPQIELGLGLKTAVGTEYGLADYAAALEVGAEWSLANIAPGLGGQLVWSAPASSSGDFKAGGIYRPYSFQGPRVEQAMISYWMPIPASVLSQLSLLNKPQNANRQAQGGSADNASINASIDGALVLSAGNVMHAQTGGQADLYLGLDRWRLQSTWGRYSTSEFLKARSPALSAIRYSVEPAKWQLEFAAGRFYNLDRGWRISSTHWFGQTSFSAFVRQSGIEGVAMPKLRFAGFEMSFPLGGSSASDVAGLSVRGQDRWSVGLETKVGQSDNYITRGYGLMYGPRHGLADITDFDRSSLSDLWAARSALRLAMQ
jgi:hypothetical protein